MSGIIAFFVSSPWARKAALYGSIILAVVLALLGFRRSSIKIGEQKVRLENAHAVAVAQKKILNAPVPTSRADAVDRLRDGSF